MTTDNYEPEQNNAHGPNSLPNAPEFRFWRLETIAFLIVAAALLIRFGFDQAQWSLAVPKQVFEYSLDMSFEPNTDKTIVGTFLPTNSQRQTVHQQELSAPNTERVEYQSGSGLISRWTGNRNSRQIAYQATVETSATSYRIDPLMALPEHDLRAFPMTLKETENIQVSHPEIAAFWQQIKPTQSVTVLSTLNAIFQATTSLESLPFKGTTDALTALRLGAASCNGKSRLFVALARHNNLPARLVGGVILTSGGKRTSHQWVEVSVQDQWIPFDPTNQHFAFLPANYLELYRGDHNLFSHSPNINFDYEFNAQEQLVAPALYFKAEEEQLFQFNLLALFARLELSEQNKAVFLLMPLCALLITGLRNLVGLKSFGIFMPMLIASACSIVGLWQGVFGFVVILIAGTLSYLCFSHMNLLKIPRLSAIITLLTVFTLVLLLSFESTSGLEIGVLALFPVIIISFIADKLHDLIQQRDWAELASASVGTLISIVMCYALLASATLQGVFALYPELFVLVLAGQVYLGKWTGGRLSELVRFRRLLSKKHTVVGMNERNKSLISGLNSPELLIMAADKLVSKKRLSQFSVPVPETLAQFKSLRQVEILHAVLEPLDEFVVKPNAGSQGNGILVVRDRQGQGFVSASGKFVSSQQITRLVCDIINGNYSQLGDADTAYIEPLIQQDQRLQTFAPYGLCDIRVVLKRGEIISAMLRIPTQRSSGKANLHQGAIGAAIDLETGVLTRALLNGKEITHHPDNQQAIVGRQLPYWNEVKKISLMSYRAIPLGYMGVDICIDQIRGPMVLEVNGRPGLEIQNITERGLTEFTPNTASRSLQTQFA